MPAGLPTEAPTWIPLAPGEKGKQTEEVYREVFCDGKYRLEVFDPATAKITGIKVVTGETETNCDLRVGMSLTSPRSGELSGEGKDFEEYFCKVRFGTPLLTRARERYAIESDETAPGTTLITIPQGAILSASDFRVWLDNDAGYLLKRVELWKDGVLRKRRTVKSVREIEPGVWVPVEGEMTYYTFLPDISMTPLPTSILKVVVDEDHSHWNEPIAENEFEVP